MVRYSFNECSLSLRRQGNGSLRDVGNEEMLPAEEARLLAMPRTLTEKARVESHLLLHPTATLCREAKERQEQREHHYCKLRGES